MCGCLNEQAGEPGEPHCWHKQIIKPDWSLSKCTSKSFWDNVWWTDETKEKSFDKAHVLFTENRIRPKKKIMCLQAQHDGGGSRMF